MISETTQFLLTAGLATLPALLTVRWATRYMTDKHVFKNLLQRLVSQSMAIKTVVAFRDSLFYLTNALKIVVSLERG